MPPIRFRIRTIMIAIVVVAVVMAVFTAVMRLYRLGSTRFAMPSPFVT